MYSTAETIEKKIMELSKCLKEETPKFMYRKQFIKTAHFV